MIIDSAAPLRVLFVNHVGRISGAENSLLSLLRHFDRQQIVPFAACPKGQLLTELQALGVTVTPIPQARLRRTPNPLSLLSQYRTLRVIRQQVEQLVAQWEIDVVHANSVAAALALGLSGPALPPRIWHCRDLLIAAPAIRWLAGRCERVIAISSVVRRHLLHAASHFANKVTLIYNGIAMDDFNPQRPAEQVRAELELKVSTPVVATVGQLVPWKRHDLLIGAAQIVSGQRPDTRFWVIGADMFGENRRYVAHLKATAPASVSFLGYRDDVADLVNAADVIAHCSTCEPLGRAILEAMSLGKPCVGPRAGGVAELIEEGRSGLLVEPASAAALAGGILSLVDDHHLAGRLGEAARERALTGFSTQATAACTQQVYRELVEEVQA